jgi:hypothetical protein
MRHWSKQWIMSWWERSPEEGKPSVQEVASQVSAVGYDCLHL